MGTHFGQAEECKKTGDLGVESLGFDRNQFRGGRSIVVGLHYTLTHDQREIPIVMPFWFLGSRTFHSRLSRYPRRRRGGGLPRLRWRCFWHKCFYAMSQQLDHDFRWFKMAVLIEGTGVGRSLRLNFNVF